MGFARTSNSTLFVGKTTVEGTAPENDSPAQNYQTLEPNSHSLSPQFNSFQSQAISASGKARDRFRSTGSGQGDITHHFHPLVLDSFFEVAMRNAFSSAYSETITASFGSPAADGAQTFSDDGTTGVLGNLNAGDLINITGASNSGNNGLKRVISQDTADQVTLYNPGGASESATSSVSADNQGTLTLGTTASFLWAERVFSDGTNDIYSEFYQDALIGNLSLNFPAGDATVLTANLQGDAPTLAKADGSPPITKQRGGSDDAFTTERLVHGMDDVTEVVLYSPTVGSIDLKNKMSQFQFQIQRPVNEIEAVGTQNVVTTVVDQPTVGGTINAYIDEVSNGPIEIVQQMIDDLDDFSLHITFGRNVANSYAIFVDTFRVTNAPTPIQGGGQVLQLNSDFSGTDARITRIPS